MTELSPETRAAVGFITSAIMRADASQYTLPGLPDDLQKAAAILGSGTGNYSADQIQSFYQALTECIAQMPWQGELPTDDHGNAVIRRDEHGKLLLDPVKKVAIHGATTTTIVRYAANVAGIPQGLLPWCLHVEIRPGRVRGYVGEQAPTSDVYVGGLPSPSPKATDELDPDRAALRKIAAALWHAEGNTEAYQIAAMAAQGYPEWRPDRPE
jgi:hypothetical protein